MTIKTLAVIGTALILTAIAPSAEARCAPRENISTHYSSSVDRHTGNSAIDAPEIKHKRTARHCGKPGRKKFKIVNRSARQKLTEGSAQIVEHPIGCPRTSFCGCGVSLHVFGYSIRELWLARNWLEFPPAAPGPGKVAARRGHVFAILKDLGGGNVLAYDPNSGGHKTRIWVRNLSGYRVVDPSQKLVWAYAG